MEIELSQAFLIDSLKCIYTMKSRYLISVWGTGRQKGLIILLIKLFIVLIVEHSWLLTIWCPAWEMARHQYLHNNQKYIILHKTQKFNRNLWGIKKLHVEQINSKGNKVTESLKGDENKIRENLVLLKTTDEFGNGSMQRLDKIRLFLEHSIKMEIHA